MDQFVQHCQGPQIVGAWTEKARTDDETNDSVAGREHCIGSKTAAMAGRVGLFLIVKGNGFSPALEFARDQGIAILVAIDTEGVADFGRCGIEQTNGPVEGLCQFVGKCRRGRKGQGGKEGKNKAHTPSCLDRCVFRKARVLRRRHTAENAQKLT
jgi:hypothetical protein